MFCVCGLRFFLTSAGADHARLSQPPFFGGVFSPIGDHTTMSKYNFGGQSGNDNEYNDINFSITPETTIRGYVGRLVVGNAGGQSVGFVMDDVTLVDGVLMERKDSPER